MVCDVVVRCDCGGQDVAAAWSIRGHVWPIRGGMFQSVADVRSGVVSPLTPQVRPARWLRGSGADGEYGVGVGVAGRVAWRDTQILQNIAHSPERDVEVVHVGVDRFDLDERALDLRNLNDRWRAHLTGSVALAANEGPQPLCQQERPVPTSHESATRRKHRF